MIEICHNCEHPLSEHRLANGRVTCPACDCAARYELRPTGLVITPERS